LARNSPYPIASVADSSACVSTFETCGQKHTDSSNIFEASRVSL